ncbi:Methyltransferase domain-containing protein [Paraburkholderia aspalathi]|uniref:Methyltransferase domain-containing protein n=1 Tax=Paraburkholderia aspalathi TaxID=1324617 RepID=A0A1I7AD62_9BURK|nr:Methyltransferase domain-containing protein [Paraburkholderia aspalathi]
MPGSRLTLTDTRVLEIGCGAGHSTQALLALGHKITAIEENPHCIEATRNRLEQNGYRVQVVSRGTPKALGPAQGFTYETEYADIGVLANVDYTLIEGDVLQDTKLVAWLSTQPRFDALVCWMIGTHTYRGHSAVATARGITENGVHRVLVQNEVYDLAKIVLRAGGILSVADRLETPSTASVRDAIMQHHREQASTTTLRVDRLRHKPYAIDRVAGGITMVPTPPTDGSAVDRPYTQSLCAVTSIKP